MCVVEDFRRSIEGHRDKGSLAVRAGQRSVGSMQCAVLATADSALGWEGPNTVQPSHDKPRRSGRKRVRPSSFLTHELGNPNGPSVLAKLVEAEHDEDVCVYQSSPIRVIFYNN